MTLGIARRKSAPIAAGAAAAFVLVLAACDDTTEPDTAAAPPTTVAASPTADAVASTTVAAVERAPEEIAKDFLDAYGAYDADEALTYLTEDAIATGAGYTGTWGSPDAFRSYVSLEQAEHIDQTVTGCEKQGESGDGVTVRCAFDFHMFRSDEIGRGPYTDNYWDIVVRDGKITSAVATWAYLTNGSSAEMWEPFQAWMRSTHPEDLQVMYPVGNPTPTEQSIRLWDERIREWVEEVKASAE